jgi:SPP1 gp7 family putative phage head morphogenesis protein
MTPLPDKEAAARLLDAWKVVQADLMRDAQRLADQIAAALAAGQDINEAWLIRQERYNALLAQVQTQVDRYALQVGHVVTQGQAAAVLLAWTVSGQQIAAGLVSAGLSADVNRLPVAAVRDLVGRLSDGSPMGDLLQTFGSDARKAASEALVSGLGRGIGPRSIAPAIRNALDVTPVRALTIARTEIVGSYRNAALQSYQANSDVISGWIWMCAKSPRTCVACLAMDGAVFVLDRPFPSHPNCRCITVPIVKGVEPTDRQTGAEWFAEQDEATQQDIMGKQAHAAYKAGDVTLRDMVGMRIDKRWGSSVRVRSLKEVLA